MTQQSDSQADHKAIDLLAKAHIGWVYTLARRQLGDAHLADDATQAVFIALWKKHKRLVRIDHPIGGWLLRATHYACANIQKKQQRQKIRERKAANMRQKEILSVGGTAMDANAALLLELDAAMRKLSTGDRDILVARFFQNQTARQIAQAFDISEAAAEKRLTRAVIKLRAIMARKQISLDNMAITALLTGGAGTAPSGLLEKVIQCAGGKAAMSVTAAHAARSIAFHNAQVPAIAGTAAVALAVGVAAVVPIAIKARQVPVKPVPAEVAPPLQTAAAHSTTAQSGVLTCVAYEMLVQKDFAWAVRTGGKLTSGKPGGIEAYDISARVVRALARAMAGRREALLGNQLHWISTAARLHPWPPLPLYFRHTFYLAGSGDGFIANTSLGLISPSVRTYSRYARVPVSFVAGSQISASFVRKPQNPPPITYNYQHTLDIRSGHAVVLLKHVYNFQGKQCYSAVVFDVESYPYHDLGALGAAINVRRYIRIGVAGLAHLAAVTIAWNHYTAVHPPTPVAGDGRWTKSLPGGAVVTVTGVASGSWPLCQWSPVGAPAGTTSEFLNRGSVMVLLQARVPAWPDQIYPGKTLPGPWTRRIIGNPMPGTDACTIGLDSGKWRIIGVARPSPAGVSGPPSMIPRNFSFMGHKIGVYYTSPPAASRIYLSLFSLPSAPGTSRRALAVGAINLNGKLIAPSPGYRFRSPSSRFQTSPARAIGEYGYETIAISPADVKRYVWITRPRHWVTFHGFALQPSPLPSAVLALQHRQTRAITQRAVGKAKPIAHIAANQTTPAGLMALLRRAMRGGNPLALEKLAYAPNSADRHLLAAEAQLNAAQKRYGLWVAAKKRFGVAQMQAAGLGEYVNPPANVDLPKHWKIRGAYATPVLPLPPGVSWPGKGQPLHSLIKKHGLWYLDLNLTKAQIGQLNAEMQRSMEVPARNAKAYKAVLTELQAGKIKDAYALRDALAAALKKYSAPGK